MNPIILINFKSYAESTGKNALKLAKICDSVAKKRKANIMVAVQNADINEISKAVKIPVFAQHVDIEFGAHTGSANIKSAREAGALGTLINHAEKKLTVDVVAKTIEECKRMKMISCVCAANEQEMLEALKSSPDYIAYEIPELIGGNVSITSANPDSVKDFVKKVGKTSKPLCGAGVKTCNDLKKAVELGTNGVLLASGITKAEDPKKALEDLLKLI